MTPNGGGQIRQRIELLHVAGLRDGEETGHGELAGRAAIAEGDLPPLYGTAQRAFGPIVGRFDAVVMHEDEEVLMVREQRGRQIAHVVGRTVQVTLGQREEFLLQRDRFRDQLGAGQRTAASRGIAAKAIPQAEQALLEPQRVTAEVPGLQGLGQFLRAPQVPREVRPAELQEPLVIARLRRQAVAAQNTRARRQLDLPVSDN
jgi:hypothetical protein